MHATTYAVYDICRALASTNRGILYFSGPKIAAKFLSMGRNTPYKAAQYLEEKGWFKLVRKSGRRADGTHAPTIYTVLDHDQWAAEHPGCCVDPSNDWKTTLSPSHVECMDLDEPSHRGERRHTLSADCPTVDTDHPTQGEQTYKEQPIQTTHTGTDACSQPFTQSVMETIPPSCDGAFVAPANSSVGEPLPQNVTDVSGTEPLGLVCRDGEWFTESGVKVHPNALAILLNKETA